MSDEPLSNMSERYMYSLNRDQDFVIEDRDSINRYLESQGIPLFEKIIDFQIGYSGLEFTVNNKPGSKFKARLFAKADIRNNIAIDVIQVDDRYYFDCGEHETAQFWFVISDSGEICTYDNTSQTVNTIFSTFEKLIETYAMQNLMHFHNKCEDRHYYELIDVHGFREITKDYFRYTFANDAYNTWLTHESLLLYQGIWFDRPAPFLHVFDDTESRAALFIQSWKDKSIIK